MRFNGAESIGGTRPVKTDRYVGSNKDNGAPRQTNLDFSTNTWGDIGDGGFKTSNITTDDGQGGSITRDPNGRLLKTVSSDGLQYSTFKGNVETIYMKDEDGKFKPFAEHRYDPKTQTGTATPYVNGKLDPNYTLKYPMFVDNNGVPELIDEPILPDEPVAAEQQSPQNQGLKMVHSMTPEEAKAKFADVTMNSAFAGNYGKKHDAQGRLTNRVYTDKAGNIEQFIEYTYNPDGTLNNSKEYSLRNGKYVLSSVIEYNEKEGYAVEQGYSSDGKPYDGFVLEKYDPNKPDEDLRLSFSPDYKFPAGLKEELAKTHGKNAPIAG